MPANSGFPFRHYLASVRRMPAPEVERLVAEAQQKGGVLGVRAVEDDDVETAAPWKLPPSGLTQPPVIRGPLPPKVSVVLGNLLYVEKEGIPPTLVNRLIRLASGGPTWIRTRDRPVMSRQL